MALSKADIKSSYPLPSYNYRVTVLDANGAHVIGCSEISGLGAESQPVTYRDGLSYLSGPKLMPGMTQTPRLTLKKGLTKNAEFLQKWMEESLSARKSQYAQKEIVIDLCDEKGLPVIRWKVAGALPVKLDAPTLSASSNEVAIASMEFIAGAVRVDYHPS